MKNDEKSEENKGKNETNDKEDEKYKGRSTIWRRRRSIGNA